MTPYSSGAACQSFVATANFAGQLIALVPSQMTAAQAAAGVVSFSGFVHSVTVGGDTTAESIILWDGLTSGTRKIFQGLTTTAGQPGTWIVDAQCDTGLFLVLSGGTTVAVTITFA